MSEIFISYRRTDAQDVAGRIYDGLTARFGQDFIFKDVDSIPLSVPFQVYIRQALEKARVVLVLIGPNWLNDGRIYNPQDSVRVEVETALSLSCITIPVTVSHGEMPRAIDLPDAINDLTYRNGLPVRPDPDFHRDMDRLIFKLEDIFSDDVLQEYLQQLISDFSALEHQYIPLKPTHDIDIRFRSMTVVGRCRSKEHELSEAIERHNPVILIGEPGTGKTTCLQQSALTLAKAAMNVSSAAGSVAAPFPIFVRLRERYYGSVGEGSERIVNMIRGIPGRTVSAEILTRGRRFVIFLDGLDEILDTLDATQSKMFLASLKDVFERYKRYCQFAVSTRKRYYSSLECEGTIELKGLTDEQIRIFVMCRFPERGEKILKVIGSDSRLKSLAQNPHFLSLYLDQWHDGVNRCSYAKLIDDHIQQRELAHLCVPGSPQQHYIYTYLSSLAYEIFKKRGPSPRADVESLRTELRNEDRVSELPKVDEFLNQQILLIPKDSTSINFCQQFVQDFFVAVHLRRRWKECWQNRRADFVPFVEQQALHDSLILAAGQFTINESNNEYIELRELVSLGSDYDIILAGKMIGAANLPVGKPNLEQELVDSLRPHEATATAKRLSKRGMWMLIGTLATWVVYIFGVYSAFRVSIDELSLEEIKKLPDLFTVMLGSAQGPSQAIMVFIWLFIAFLVIPWPVYFSVRVFARVQERKLFNKLAPRIIALHYTLTDAARDHLTKLEKERIDSAPTGSQSPDNETDPVVWFFKRLFFKTVDDPFDHILDRLLGSVQFEPIRTVQEWADLLLDPSRLYRRMARDQLKVMDLSDIRYFLEGVAVQGIVERPFGPSGRVVRFAPVEAVEVLGENALRVEATRDNTFEIMKEITHMGDPGSKNYAQYYLSRINGEGFSRTKWFLRAIFIEIVALMKNGIALIRWLLQWMSNKNE